MSPVSTPPTLPISRKSFKMFLAIIVLLVIAAPTLRHAINAGWIGMWMQVIPPSLPGGLYWTETSDSLLTGIPTIICYTGDAAKFAVERGYAEARRRPLPTAPCPPPYTHALKPLAGVPGDTVTVTRDSIQVNTRTWLKATILEQDSDGRPMPNAIGTHILGPTECFALSTWHPKSFDSRYIGPIQCPANPRTALPVSTSDAEAVLRMAAQISGTDLSRDE